MWYIVYVASGINGPDFLDTREKEVLVIPSENECFKNHSRGWDGGKGLIGVELHFLDSKVPCTPGKGASSVPVEPETRPVSKLLFHVSARCSSAFS